MNYLAFPEIVVFLLAVAFSVLVGAEMIPSTSIHTTGSTVAGLQFNNGANPTSSDDYTDRETDFQNPAITQRNQLAIQSSQSEDRGANSESRIEKFLRHRQKLKQNRQRFGQNTNQFEPDLQEQATATDPESDNTIEDEHRRYGNEPYALPQRQGKHLATNAQDFGSHEATNWNTDEQRRPNLQDGYRPKFEGDDLTRRRRPDASQISRGTREDVHFTPLGMSAPVGPIFVKKRLQRYYGKYFTANDGQYDKTYFICLSVELSDKI